MTITQKSVSASTSNPLVGVWENTGNTATNYEILTFYADGTGILTVKSGTSNFNYTYDSDSKLLKLWYVDSTVIYNYNVNITGDSLMLTSGSSTMVYTRKK